MKTAARFVVGTALVSLFAACSPGERVREIDWAKAALARNPAYEILATDESAGIFTVRDTTDGAVHKLRLEDLVAAPLPPKAARSAASTGEPAAPAETPDTSVQNAQPENASAPALAAQPAPSDGAMTAAAGAGEPLAEGPGYSITRGDAQAPAAAPTLEGPGYSITRHEAEKRPAAPRASPPRGA